MARKKIVELTRDKWNEQLDYFDAIGIKYEIKETPWMVSALTNAYCYKARLSEDKIQLADPRQISKEFGKKTKYHYLDKDDTIDIAKEYGYKQIKTKDGTKIKWAIKTAFGYSYTNDFYARKWLRCWSYDINSAFSYAMLQPIPDTRVKPRKRDIVKENEMGFYYGGGATTTVGDYADFIFPLILSPFTEYIEEYYQKKENAKNKQYRKLWKDYLNIPTGCIQRHNIFIRNAIIFYSNRYIKNFIDEDTVYCNIDCIISLKPRPDIPTGMAIGNFKPELEHVNAKFKFIEAGIYQWDNECHYKGIKGQALTDIENTNGWYENYKKRFKYKFDAKTRRILDNGETW